jgi:hypothetical protein
MVERAKADIWIEWAKILLNRQRCELRDVGDVLIMEGLARP